MRKPNYGSRKAASEGRVGCYAVGRD